MIRGDDVHGHVGDTIHLFDGLPNHSSQRGVIAGRELKGEPYSTGRCRRDVANRPAFHHVAPGARVPNAPERVGDSVL
jgi:hypothetical protein